MRAERRWVKNPFSWANYQVGGSFANQSAEYLDGQPLNIGYINLPIVIPTQDSVGEFKVQYNNLGAEWGKFAGGVVNLSTKSGSNQFHGEAHEYLRNKVFNSQGYFDTAKPPYTQNQYGFSVGGPVIKDKTFFFTSWEQFRLRQGQTLTTTVPVTAFRQGDFSALTAAGISCTILTRSSRHGTRTTPYANNQIPVAEFSPAATRSGIRYSRRQLEEALPITLPRPAARAATTISLLYGRTKTSQIRPACSVASPILG